LKKQGKTKITSKCQKDIRPVSKSIISNNKRTEKKKEVK
jgi:hypothetical protein